MPPKKECYTKPKKDGGTYTTCVEGQKKKKIIKKKPKVDTNKAATTIQAAVRGRQARAKVVTQNKAATTIQAAVRGRQARAKVAPKVVVEAVEPHTGLTRSAMNQMNFIDLMKQLPTEIKSNITKQVKDIGKADVSEKYLSSLPTKELLAKYIGMKGKVGYYSRYKGNALFKNSLTLVKEVGKRFGKLPQTIVKTYGRGMDAQFGRGMMKYVTGSKELYTADELYELLFKKYGNDFAETVKSELMSRLGEKNQVSEKVYKKKLAENMEELAERGRR